MERRTPSRIWKDACSKLIPHDFFPHTFKETVIRSGPLPVISIYSCLSRVQTPLRGAITPITHLLSAIYSLYNLPFITFVYHLVTNPAYHRCLAYTRVKVDGTVTMVCCFFWLPSIYQKHTFWGMENFHVPLSSIVVVQQTALFHRRFGGLFLWMQLCSLLLFHFGAHLFWSLDLIRRTVHPMMLGLTGGRFGRFLLLGQKRGV